MKRPADDVNSESNDMEGAEDYDIYSSDEDLDIVRQDSNYSKLSAESWLRVDSEYDEDDDAADEEHLGLEYDENEEHFWNDVATRLKRRAPYDRSVLECVVELLSGTGATKKRKLFLSPVDRRVWLDPNLKTLHWSSKRKGVGSLELEEIRVVKGWNETRAILVETADRKRLGLSMSNHQDLQVWVRGLACFSSLQAKIFMQGLNVSEREDYDPLRDSWGRAALVKKVQVGDYYLLDALDKPRSQAILAFSASELGFYSIKLLSPNISALLGPEVLACVKELDHPNVLKYKDFLQCRDQDGLYAVFEHVPRGIVVSGYKLDGNKAVSEDMARKLINDVAGGVMYLHSRRVSLGNIRPDNLLFAADGSLKVNPLGGVFYEHSKRSEPITFGTEVQTASAFAFSAPERCREAKKMPKAPRDAYATDAWSVGALLYFMVYGRVPFLGNSAESIQEAITTSRLEFPDTPKVSAKAKDFLRKILGEKDPSKRVRVEQIINHPWLLEPAGGGVSLFASKRRKAYSRAELGYRKVILSEKQIEGAISTAKYTDPEQDKERP